MFETIGVIAHGFGCGCGARHAQNVSQFVRKGLEIRPLAAAGCLPAGDKFLNLQKPAPTAGLFNLLTFLHRYRMFESEEGACAIYRPSHCFVMPLQSRPFCPFFSQSAKVTMRPVPAF